MTDQIIYQFPAIITDDSIIPEYRQRAPVLSWKHAQLFCFQEPNMADVKKVFGILKEYGAEIVPGTPEIVERYARLDRELKREHGDFAQVNWGNVQRRLLEIYNDYLSLSEGPETTIGQPGQTAERFCGLILD